MHNREGHMLLGPGVSLTTQYIARLRDLGCSALWVDDEDTRDITYEQILTDTTRMAASIEIQNTFAMAAREAPSLRAASAQEIRSAVEGRRTQQRFDGDPIFPRLLAGGEEKGFCDVVLQGMVDFSSEYMRNTAIVSTVDERQGRIDPDYGFRAAVSRIRPHLSPAATRPRGPCLFSIYGIPLRRTLPA
jgi:hypothetical protein